MSRSILVIADKQESNRFALEKAKSIALPLNAKIEVARFLSELEVENALEEKNLVEKARKNLDDTVSELFADAKIPIKCQVIASEHIADWVEGTSEQKHFDLVVKTGHRTEKIFHTPTDWHLMRQLSCPILFANEQKWKSQKVVMTCVDLSTNEETHKELNKLELEWTKLWSEAFNCSIHITYSIPIASALLELDMVEQNEYLEKKKPEAERQLAKLLEEFGLSNVHTHITAGPPEKMLPHVASELKADLVIMGFTGKLGLTGLLFGNTAEKVLHRLRTDTLIVEASGLNDTHQV